MFCLIYLSEATRDFNHTELKQLADDSALSNRVTHITGYLYFSRGKFVQYIESDTERNINDLMIKLKSDNRHNVIFQLSSSNLIKRRFPHWSMEYLSKTDLLKIDLGWLLQDHMEHMTNLAANDLYNFPEPNEKMVWQMVDVLAEKRSQLREVLSII